MALSSSPNAAPTITLTPCTGAVQPLLKPSQDVTSVPLVSTSPIHHDHSIHVADALPGDYTAEEPVATTGYSLETSQYSPRSRPPLSRQSTQEDSATSVLFGSNHEQAELPTDLTVQRARTTIGFDETTSIDAEIPKRLLKSRTDPGSEKSKHVLDLGDQISERMKDKIGWGEPKPYLDEESLIELVTPNAVKKALKKERDMGRAEFQNIVDFAVENPKVVAITLLVHTNKSDRTKAIGAFRSHDFGDNCLPVEKLSLPEICPVQFKWESDSDAEDSDDPDDSHSDAKDSDDPDNSDEPYSSNTMPRKCQHIRHADAFHGDPWKLTTFNTFTEKQWGFLIQDIWEEIFKYDFGEHRILPFVCQDEAVGGGHFGDIFPATMLAKYQNAIITEKGTKTINVAIKEMKQYTRQEYDNHGNWTREATALRTFNKLKDQHIVRGICAFIQRGKRYIVMEWADGGDFRQIYSKHPRPHLELTGHRVAQFLEEFRGLANALHQMHFYKVVSIGGAAGTVIDPDLSEAEKLKSQTVKQQGEDSKTEESHQDQPNTADRKTHFEEPRERIKISEPVRSANSENWRHGDLKPDNILSFSEAGSGWLGTLKLADLGRARQHMDRTGQRMGTNEIFSTLPYDPPEVWTSLDKGRSRLVDVWAFGCVLLESLIWLFFGVEELSNFKNRAITLGSLYWSAKSVHNKTAKLNDSTFAWIDQLLAQDPECESSMRGSAMRDLVELVKQKLLVLELPKDSDVPEQGSRINSQTLVKELDAIIKKGSQDSAYLFSGRARDGLTPPRFTQQPEEVQEKKPTFLSPDMNLNGAHIVQHHTPAPWSARPNGTGQTYDSYIHDFDEKWSYVEDNSFAGKVLRRPETDINQSKPGKNSVLCDRCSQLDWYDATFKLQDSLESLRRKKIEEKCELCTMLLRVAERVPNSNWVEFDRVSSGLRLNKSNNLPVLTVRQTSEQINISSDPALYIQVGFPRISKGATPAHFDLLKAWLEDCDKHHPSCKTKRSHSAPTRVIDVGTVALPCLRLVESSSLPESERNALRYVALSYPWGDSPPHEHRVTNRDNINEQQRGIPENLPRTLDDAVKTTRHIGVRYLWVDSLCIKQGEGGDFAQEADRMKDVFSSAYVVIAATKAEGSSSGFLNRISNLEYGKQHDAVWIPNLDANNVLVGHIFVSEPVDDFDQDVLKSLINQRGWVFQERALARRTIHFANNQTYWECGNGIRCETLTKMTNARVGFLGDPNFPTYGMKGSKGGDITFYEDLYERYSKLSFKDVEDRPFAISGLEQRLIEALKDKGGSGLGYWGIFEDYWGRGLLWQRADETTKMIRLSGGANNRLPAPSWSWEGHAGGITFMKPDPHSVEWLGEEIILPWKRLNDGPARMTTASYQGERCLRGKARDFVIPEKCQDNGTTCFNLVFDDDTVKGNRDQLKCIVIGIMKIGGRPREEVRNYVLILARKKGAAWNVYERVGAGFIDGSLISYDDGSAISVLVE